MSSNTQKSIGEFQVKKLSLYNYDGLEIDITQIHQGFVIYEDIEASTLKGEISILDGINLSHDFPIIGEETIDITYEQHLGKKTHELKFRVYQISPKTLVKDRLFLYTLYFTSEEFFTSLNTRISKSFKDKKISGMVQNVFESLDSEKTIEVEETKYIQHLIIPNWSPFQTLNWLSSRAISATEDSVNYKFFETVDGFKFVSLDSLIQGKEPVAEYHYGHKNVSQNTKDIKDEHFSIIQWDLDSHFDVLQNQVTGFYGGKLITHNLIQQTWDKVEYDYTSDFDKFPHSDSEKLISSGNPFAGKANSHLVFFSSQKGNETEGFITKLESNIRPNKCEEWLLQRNARTMQFNAMKLNAVVAGDSERMIGDIIEVTIPGQGIPDTEKDKIDRYISGNWMITAIKHQVQADGYFMSMELSKDAYYLPLRGTGLS
tara:strand:+ start:161 stop:1450 length:1290 start_codon:yes stop_codon:yes gene_type:complete